MVQADKEKYDSFMQRLTVLTDDDIDINVLRQHIKIMEEEYYELDNELPDKIMNQLYMMDC